MRGDAGAGGPLVPPQAASRATRTGAGLAPTVFPSDEAHGLGEVFGELRQLGGAVGEVFDGLELLRRVGGDGIGLGGRGLSAPLRLLDGRADPPRQRREAALQFRVSLAGTDCALRLLTYNSS